jgi:predicted nucleic acid-binding protein
VIVVDTSSLLALLNGQDRHHRVARTSFEQDGARWVIPWAVLPELDYLARKRMSEDVARASVEDLRDGAFRVDARVDRDLRRRRSCGRNTAGYRSVLSIRS